MKTLAHYLAEYLDTEIERIDAGKVFPDESIVDWLLEQIKEGIEAYQSTENCTIGICGGDCPDCSNKIPMERDDAILYNGEDEIEVCCYQCPECGYIVYG